jgi:hypothetical protein
VSVFLSALVTQLESDGCLVVDLTDERGPVLKFGPLGEGMPWSRLEGGRWVPTDHDYGTLLVSDAHERRPELPVQRYLASLAPEEFASLNRVRYLQATALQLVARWREARDLLHANPLLLWLVAERYVAEPALRHRVPEMLLQPQKELLEWVLGQPVKPTQVRWLGRLLLTSGDRAALWAIRRVVGDGTLVAKLRHWPWVPSGLLPLVLESPAVAELAWLREEAAAIQNAYDAARVVQQYRRLLRDTVRMIGLVNAAVRDAPIDLRAYRSIKRVQVLHDRLLTAARKLGWAKLLEADVAPTQAFPAPPIPSDERFAAIANVAELIQEAERMKHCVVTRAADVAAGACALYRVKVAGERATLELSLGPNGEPLEIDQFRLACNAEPSKAAWDAAQHWLEEGRRRWRERQGR